MSINNEFSQLEDKIKMRKSKPKKKQMPGNTQQHKNLTKKLIPKTFNLYNNQKIHKKHLMQSSQCIAKQNNSTRTNKFQVKKIQDHLKMQSILKRTKH